MTRPHPDAAGIGALELVAPDNRCVATLIKELAHEPIQIAVPDREREDWPRPGDTRWTAVRWEEDKWFFPDTKILQQRMDDVINDDQQDKGTYYLH